MTAIATNNQAQQEMLALENFLANYVDKQLENNSGQLANTNEGL